MLHAVIMSGGSGTRFWPQSRQQCPKQLQPLVGSTSLLQQTVERLDGLVPPERTWVVTNTLQADATREQLPQLPADQILAEPQARNTAPCLGLAAIHLQQIDPDAVMLAMPADHLIDPPLAFAETARHAEQLVNDDPSRLVLMGIIPQRPATGYGYIRRGTPLPGTEQAFAVEAFHEKPDRATAESYIAAGDTLWNCGIFTWRVDTILNALAEHQPQIATGMATIRDALGDADYNARLNDVFQQLPSISIDHAVLEPSSSTCLIEAPFQWNDVGSWRSLADVVGTDSDGNTLQGNVVVVDSNSCIIHSDSEHLVTAVGVDGLVIVHTADATLVARRDDEDGLKRLVQQLQEQGRADCL